MRRALLLVTVAAALLATMVPAAGAPQADSAFQIAEGRQPYVVLLADDPVVAYEGDIPGLARTKPGKGQKVNPNSPAVRAYRSHLEEQRAEAVRSAGIDASQVLTTYDFALTGFSAVLTEAEAERLAAQKDVIAVMKDELQEIHTDTSGEFLGLTEDSGAYDREINGSGVIVGIIDTGIWPEHPSFADDGSYSDPGVSVPCEFGDTGHNPEDLPFECNNKLLGARDMRTLYNSIIGPELYNSARDADGHGTHTAGTAAGNADVEAEIFGISRGVISGIAPRAHIIAYKGCGDLGCFVGDLADAIDQAVADGVDVINYSIGSPTPIITGADDIAFLFAADAGVFVATSNGNSGPGASTVGSPAAAPWVTSVGASHHSRMFQGSVNLGDSSEFFGASVTPGVGPAPLVDGAALGNESCSRSVTFSPAPTGMIVLCKGAVGRAAKSQAVMEQGGVGMILYNDFPNQTLPSDNHYVPSLHVSNADGLAIKAYIAGAAGGATAEIVQGVAVEREVAPFMAYFSSRGPVRAPGSADIIKPDVTAPGVQILAGNSPAVGFDAPGELFQAIQGTSMSSPHVAGLFALLKQAHPDWSAAAAKSALMTTATQDVFKEDQVTPADPFDMGAGHVNGRSQGSSPDSMFNPGLVYDAGFFEYLGFLCDVAPEVFSNPTATCTALGNAGIPTTAENLNYPSIAASQIPGSLTLQRTVTNVSGRALRLNAVVEEPPGFDVSVSPSSLNLRPGQSATFEVAFTNVSAPVEVWRFGSLTWQNQQYSIRSPIAARGVLFEAPAELTGSGESGSLSFDVSFGYTGSYTAGAHGLEPATVTSDNVLQDPDQDFSPDDVAAGGANLHQFTLSGAAVFKIAMPPEATEPDADLDIFVYNPSGQLVASSTAAGTDEEIVISTPADGTWSVYVHGWAAPGGDSDYDLYTWVVSATPGGNLTIDSAPSSATLGTTGTIEVSWSGATTGQWHLGAVSHTGDAGLMGLTLIEVDNR